MDRFHWLEYALHNALFNTYISLQWPKFARSIHGKFPRGFAVNGHFAVNFRGGFPCKIVPCPGAGHRGQWVDYCQLGICSNGGVSMTYTGASCLIGCEVSMHDAENPLIIVVDSSSLSAEFHIQIVPCPGAGYRRTEAILWSVNDGCLFKGT